MKSMKPSTKYWKIALNIISMILAVLFCFFLLPKIIVFLMPFIIGGIIALIANPVVKFLEKRIKIVRRAGSAVVIVLTIALVVFLGYVVISMLIEQIVGFAGNLPDLWQNVSDTMTELSKSYDLLIARMPEAIRDWLTGMFSGFNDNFFNLPAFQIRKIFSKFLFQITIYFHPFLNIFFTVILARILFI